MKYVHLKTITEHVCVKSYTLNDTLTYELDVFQHARLFFSEYQRLRLTSSLSCLTCVTWT